MVHYMGESVIMNEETEELYHPDLVRLAKHAHEKGRAGVDWRKYDPAESTALKRLQNLVGFADLARTALGVLSELIGTIDDECSVRQHVGADTKEIQASNAYAEAQALLGRREAPQSALTTPAAHQSTDAQRKIALEFVQHMLDLIEVDDTGGNRHKQIWQTLKAALTVPAESREEVSDRRESQPDGEKDLKPGMAFRNSMYDLFHYVGKDSNGVAVFDFGDKEYSTFGGPDSHLEAHLERVPEKDRCPE